jgi:hypothetical protein
LLWRTFDVEREREKGGVGERCKQRKRERETERETDRERQRERALSE